MQQFSKKRIANLGLWMALVISFIFSSCLTAEAAAPPMDFTELVKAAEPAVVNISTERLVKRQPRGNFFMMPGFPGMDDDFERFFEQFDPFGMGPTGPRGRGGRPDGNNQERPMRKEKSLGSGFIISEDGYVVTNYHVVKGADSIQVNFYNNQKKETSYKAKVVGSDQETDLALLKIDAGKPLPTLKFGDSDALQVGSWVLAIGNPFGLDHSVTAGILSAKWRKIGSGAFDDYLQTDASINPGNSGGPLLNMNGEVIGINTAIVPQGQGLGFAIPANLAKQIIETLKTDKKISRGWIGVTIQDVDESTAKALKLPEASGALIGSVIEGQPAAKAGIEAGDVIIKVGDTPVKTSDDLLRAVAGLKPKSSTNITLWREGSTKEVKVILGERGTDSLAENDGGSDSGKSEASTTSRLGMELRTLTPKEASRLRISGSGVIIADVTPESPADEVGLRAGDVLVAVDRTKVKDSDEAATLISQAVKKHGAVMLQLSREGQAFIASMELPKDKSKDKDKSGDKDKE